jgi:hypothetical protein
MKGMASASVGSTPAIPKTSHPDLSKYVETPWHRFLFAISGFRGAASYEMIGIAATV